MSIEKLAAGLAVADWDVAAQDERERVVSRLVERACAPTGGERERAAELLAMLGGDPVAAPSVQGVLQRLVEERFDRVQRLQREVEARRQEVSAVRDQATPLRRRLDASLAEGDRLAAESLRLEQEQAELEKRLEGARSNPGFSLQRKLAEALAEIEQRGADERRAVAGAEQGWRELAANVREVLHSAGGRGR